MDEVWKDIYFIENGIEYDYRGLYQVSNFGRVKSLGNGNSNFSKERILKAGKHKSGYLNVILCKNSKQKNFKVHRLVAFMFINGYFDGAEVDHIDTDKTNNNVDNLRWCTKIVNQNNPLTLKHLSEAKKGKEKTDEHKRKMSKSKTGEKNPMYGRTGENHPMSGRTGEKNPSAKKIIQIDPLTKEVIKIWDYMKQATDFYNISKTTLNPYLKGKAKTGHEYKGYLWYYLSDYEA